MPFVRVDLIKGKSADSRKTLGEIIYKAMTDVINVPENDKFQIITEHAPDEMNVTDSYLARLGIVREADAWAGRAPSPRWGEGWRGFRTLDRR
jgi:hypothetical protein